MMPLASFPESDDAAAPGFDALLAAATTAPTVPVPLAVPAVVHGLPGATPPARWLDRPVPGEGSPVAQLAAAPRSAMPALPAAAVKTAVPVAEATVPIAEATVAVAEVTLAFVAARDETPGRALPAAVLPPVVALAVPTSPNAIREAAPPAFDRRAASPDTVEDAEILSGNRVVEPEYVVIAGQPSMPMAPTPPPDPPRHAPLCATTRRGGSSRCCPPGSFRCCPPGSGGANDRDLSQRTATQVRVRS